MKILNPQDVILDKLKNNPKALVAYTSQKEIDDYKREVEDEIDNKHSKVQMGRLFKAQRGF